MGRFLNSRIVGLDAQQVKGGGHLSTVSTAKISGPPVIAANSRAETTIVTDTTAGPRASLAQRIGLMMLCVYLISGYATDLSYRFLGTKPYVSMISGLALFICFVISGRALLALQTRVGRLWAFLMCWMVLATLFSRWRGGSADLLMDYIPKYHLVMFYIVAVVVTIEDFRTVIRACALGGVILLLSCLFFGQGDASGRFSIPSNIYLSNPNDLAMQLLICMGFFLFLWKQPGKLGRVVGALGLCAASFYLLKTGSRGAMVAAAVFYVVWILFSRRRLVMVAAVGVAGAVLVAAVPDQTIGRLRLILVNPNKHASSTEAEQAAVQSQIERQRLVRTSLMYSVTNPLFGIGPGQFSQSIWEDGKKEGRHEASLGTHNS
jgi:hypothetical protein